MARNMVNIDRQTPMLLPVDLREWVAKDDLVHFVIEAVEGLDLRLAAVNERGTGSAQYPPGMLLGLLIYSYANGVFSSRRIERSTYGNVATRYLCADTHPDHDTIAKFRREHLALFEQSFTQILGLAREMGLVQMGTVVVDGTKLSANASKRANVNAEQLRRADVAVAKELLSKADEADRNDRDEGGGGLPPGLTNGAERRARLAAAKAKLAERQDPQAKVNTTDPDSGLQPPSQPGGGFTQGYNAQAAVESGPARLIVAARVVSAPSDHNQLSDTVAAIPPSLERLAVVVADRGYDSHKDIVRTQAQSHASVLCPPSHRFNPKGPSGRGPKRRALHAERAQRFAWARSAEGQVLLKLRATLIEPVFGYIKSALGFRGFRLRGLPKVNLEWKLLSLAYNITRLWRCRPA